MIATRLETGRELWVIVLFHVTGTAMELFKTDMGSWMLRRRRRAADRRRAAVQRLHVRRRRLVHGARLPALRPRLHALPAPLAHRDRRRGDLRELLHAPLVVGSALGAACVAVVAAVGAHRDVRAGVADGDPDAAARGLRRASPSSSTWPRTSPPGRARGRIPISWTAGSRCRSRSSCRGSCS